MITIDQLQRDQYAWARKNFGPCQARWPALGVFEELGELAHSQLKQEQTIRGTFEEHEAAKKDAVADTLIYLIEYASCMEWQIVDLLVEQEETLYALQEATEGSEPVWDCLEKLLYLVQYPEHDGRDVLAQEDVVQILLNLCLYCRKQGWSLQELVETTWLGVSQRDWTKNKKDGGDTLDADDKKMAAFCAFIATDKGWSLQELVETTWLGVSQRDWMKNKKDGGDTLDQDLAKLTEYRAFLASPKGKAALKQQIVESLPGAGGQLLTPILPTSAIEPALTLVEIYYKGLNGISYPTDSDIVPYARALQALKDGKVLQEALDPLHAGGAPDKEVEFFVLRSDDPHAMSALYGYSESLRGGYDDVPSNEKRADEIWTQADRWGGRDTKATQAEEPGVPGLSAEGAARIGGHMAEGLLEAAKRAEDRGYSFSTPPKDDKKS